MQVQQLNQFFQELMALLYKALRDASVHHTVKPQIISAFGDAALALGPSFVEVNSLFRYIESALLFSFEWSKNIFVVLGACFGNDHRSLSASSEPR